jgi:hypothetical protein
MGWRSWLETSVECKRAAFLSAGLRGLEKQGSSGSSLSWKNVFGEVRQDICDAGLYLCHATKIKSGLEVSRGQGQVVCCQKCCAMYAST